MNELTFGALGKGTANPDEVCVADSGISYEDGKFKVDTSVLSEEYPYAWYKVYKNDIDESTVDMWHWGLYADESSDVDIWGGVFVGYPLSSCGSRIGLDTTDLVDGRVIKMWATKDDEVVYNISAELEVV